MEDLPEMPNSLDRLLRASQAMKLKFHHTSHLIITVIMELKQEVEKLKKNRVNQSFIDKKEFQINSLASFYNSTESIINQYDSSIIIANINNQGLEELLLHVKASNLKKFDEFAKKYKGS